MLTCIFLSLVAILLQQWVHKCLHFHYKCPFITQKERKKIKLNVNSEYSFKHSFFFTLDWPTTAICLYNFDNFAFNANQSNFHIHLHSAVIVLSDHIMNWLGRNHIWSYNLTNTKNNCHNRSEKKYPFIVQRITPHKQIII